MSKGGRCAAPGRKSGGGHHEEDESQSVAPLAGYFQEAMGDDDGG